MCIQRFVRGVPGVLASAALSCASTAAAAPLDARDVGGAANHVAFIATFEFLHERGAIGQDAVDAARRNYSGSGVYEKYAAGGDDAAFRRAVAAAAETQVAALRAIYADESRNRLRPFPLPEVLIAHFGNGDDAQTHAKRSAALEIGHSLIDESALPAFDILDKTPEVAAFTRLYMAYAWGEHLHYMRVTGARNADVAVHRHKYDPAFRADIAARFRTLLEPCVPPARFEPRQIAGGARGLFGDYATIDATAAVALASIAMIPQRANVEYGSVLARNRATGRYYFTVPVRGATGEVTGEQYLASELESHAASCTQRSDYPAVGTVHSHPTGNWVFGNSFSGRDFNQAIQPFGDDRMFEAIFLLATNGCAHRFKPEPRDVPIATLDPIETPLGDLDVDTIRATAEAVYAPALVRRYRERAEKICP